MRFDEGEIEVTKKKITSHLQPTTLPVAFFPHAQDKVGIGKSKLSFYPNLESIQMSPSKPSLSREMVLRLIEALKEIQQAFERSGVTEQDLQEAGRRIRREVVGERYGAKA
jgi:hypothetical protein